MDNVKDLISKFSGKYDPVKYNIRFTVSKFDNSSVISGDIDWLVEDMVGSTYLSDLLDKKELNKIPTEYGVYLAELWVQSYRSNNFDEPEEWDMNIWLENIKLELSLT